MCIIFYCRERRRIRQELSINVDETAKITDDTVDATQTEQTPLLKQ